MGKKNKVAVKKNTISQGNSSNTHLVESLKTENAHLVKDVAECRLQIACLVKDVAEYQRELSCLYAEHTSTIAENDIFHGIQQDVFALVISFSIHEFISRTTTETTAILDTEKTIRKKIEVGATAVNAKEIDLHAIAKEKDGKDKKMEQANLCDRRRKNLFRDFFATLPLVAAVGAALVAFWKFSRK